MGQLFSLSRFSADGRWPGSGSLPARRSSGRKTLGPIPAPPRTTPPGTPLQVRMRAAPHPSDMFGEILSALGLGERKWRTPSGDVTSARHLT